MAPRRLVSLSCLSAALFAALSGAARPAVGRFDIPFTLEHGKYIVVLATPAGPRRFIFDTGAPRTVISSSLRDSLRLIRTGTLSAGDFEGHRTEVETVCVDSLRMGEALFRKLETIVLPDTSLIFPCFGIDGVVGCDLLHGFAVRMCKADSTISFATDVRSFGKIPKGRSCRMYLGSGCPHLAVRLCNGSRSLKTYVRFDTGSPDYYHYSYREQDRWLDRGFVAGLRCTEGYARNMGWSNRSVVKLHFRATVPRFEVAGSAIADMPLESTYGHYDILGCRLLDWGQVVLDFPRRRFYFLPYAAATSEAPPQPVFNFTPWIVAGQLVVGQVWDDALREVIAPGDRIATIDGAPWSGDVCAFLLDQEQYAGAVCEVDAAEGRVRVRIVKM